jgi:hypothetical protein
MQEMMLTKFMETASHLYRCPATPTKRKEGIGKGYEATDAAKGWDN